MFGSKKPTEFDKNQDRQLQQLMRNQKVLVDNNAFFIKQNKTLWSWVKWLEAQVKTLDSRLTLNEQKDAQQAALFNGLAKASKQKAVEVQTVNAEAGTTP